MRLATGTLFASYDGIFTVSAHFVRSPLTLVLNRPICPQSKYSTLEAELFGLSPSSEEFKALLPKAHLKQDEFECLNLNITCPASASPSSNLPVMLWIHGYVLFRIAMISLSRHL